MNFISLFSGIGGFEIGLESVGMKCIGQVEIDDYCNAILSKHWPDVKRIRDIHDVKGNEFGTAELVCGGIPCQPASNAGKRRGTEDDRWLWPETFKLVQAIKPRWCLFENVCGILTLESGVVFRDLLLELESFGYEVQCFIIPACAVDAKHRRERVWIVADSESERRRERNTDAGGSSKGTGAQEERSGFTERSRWKPESGIRRVAYGVPGRVDRLRSLGNAVVPQIVEIIGKAIMEAERLCNDRRNI